MVKKKELIAKCERLIKAFKTGELGQTIMPEDQHPNFSSKQREERLVYFTLPMALNYQRDSYKLWASALKTWNDVETRKVFDVKLVSKMSDGELRQKLLKYKVALQPNKHIKTWKTIAGTIYNKWGSLLNFIDSTSDDFLILKNMVQISNKKVFPYLSGPKIFNYWSFILGLYCDINFKNKDQIEIAPDTHIIQCSILLGVITKQEAETLSKDEISKRWRELLKGSDITPIEMHAPLWFWSRNEFIYKL